MSSSSDVKDVLDSTSSENMSLCSTHSPVKERDVSWIHSNISNEAEWNLFHRRAHEDSLYLNLTILQHYNAWMKLIMSCDKTSNKDQTVLKCVKEMIETMPVRTVNDDDNKWCQYIDGAYTLKDDGILSDEGFSLYFMLLEQKLLVSYTKPGIYWNHIRTIEKAYFQFEDDRYIEKCLHTYKKQFSTAYIDIEIDIEKFIEFTEGLTLQINLEDFFSTEGISKLTTEANAYMSCFETHSHHVPFEDWITNLLEQNPPQVRRAVNLCEETVCDEKYSICYHLIHAKTLCSVQMHTAFEILEINERLFKSLKRGIHLGVNECEEMTFYYLDYALNAAAKQLNREQSKEIFYDIIEKMRFEDSEDKYFASRRALIFGLKTLIECKKMNISEFPNKIVELLIPVSDDGFNGEVIVANNSKLPDYELRCLELKRLAISCRQQLMNTPWIETLTIWLRGLSNLCDPHSLLEFAAFVRENGSPTDVEGAYVKAIEQVKKLNDSSEGSYNSRRCLFLLHKQLREFVGIHGGQMDTLKFLEKLSIMQSKSSSDNNERYFLSHNTQIYENDIAYYASITSMNITSSRGTYVIGEGQNPGVPVIEMEKLTVEQESVSEDNTSVERIGYPVFLSNLHFKATKKNIIAAFKENGLNVTNVKMSRKPKSNSNFGFATIEFNTEKEAERALKEHDRIKILGRPTFVSVCKEKDETFKLKRPKKDPTALFITGLPEEYCHTDKLNLYLREFGHIKNIELQAKPGSMTVEYHLPGDSYVGLRKLQEKFGKDIRVKRISLGENDKLNFKHLKTQSIGSLPGTSGSVRQSVRGRSLMKTFIPQQLRQQMRKKLVVTKSGYRKEESQDSMSVSEDLTSPESKSSQEYSDDFSPPSEKRMKLTHKEGERLTNEDFRQMLMKGPRMDEN